MAAIWATFVKNIQIFVPTSGHTAYSKSVYPKLPRFLIPSTYLSTSRKPSYSGTRSQQDVVAELGSACLIVRNKIYILAKGRKGDIKC